MTFFIKEETLEDFGNVILVSDWLGIPIGSRKVTANNL